MNYRKLSEAEITELTRHGCSATNWRIVTVTPNFSARNIYYTHFEGEVKIGNLTGKLSNGKRAGLYKSYIENCIIEDDVFISDVKRLVKYRVATGAFLMNIGSIEVEGETTFGNGTELEVLNEGGGRELPMYDRMTSQIAYLLVVYRHDEALVNALKQMIATYVAEKKSDMGLIDTDAKITNTSIIKNVNIGPYTIIDGAAELQEGTIMGCAEAPAQVGSGVIAREFIILSGSKVDSGAMLDCTFVGQGVKIGKQFSSENSVFFANCEGFHSEVCSIFAGPYTVTHHRSTLLIAGMFSFYNAGSGTNQSNHMYKLGPLHQGIIERGAKTGSFSYMLWPSRLGAFSVVTGKHGGNFDTSDFPFSYVTLVGEKSFVTPAMNLFTVGTRRDVEKWPNRDRRKDPEKLDLIQFEFPDPYITNKVLKSISILNALYEKTPKEQDALNYKGARIKRLMLKSTRKYYEILIPVSIGNQLIKRLKDNTAGWREALAAGTEGVGDWLDISGMTAPASVLTTLIDDIKSGKTSGLSVLEESLREIHGKYADYSWNWTAKLIEDRTGKKPADLSVEELQQLIEGWKINSIKLNNMTMKDAGKEFDANSKIGFGIDGDEETRDQDFVAVRGDYETNKFIIGLQEENGEIEKQAEELKLSIS